MRAIHGFTGLFACGVLASCAGSKGPGDDTDAADTDVADTDVADTDVGDTDVNATCDDLTAGALITLDVAGDSFTFWSANPEFINQAIVLLESHTLQVPVFGTITLGAGCDPQWDWTVDAEDQSWADVTIEVCDGTPSYIQTDPGAWLASPGQWCPWSAVVTAVDDRR